MSKERGLSRDRIVGAIVGALEPLDYVYALWEGGAVAFDRVDEWSDVDICVDAEDERVGDVFPVVEHALEALAPIELKYEVPAPALGEYVQAFYRLEGAGRFLLVDFAVFKHSAKDKLLEPEIHGNSRFHFNRGPGGGEGLKIPRLDQPKLVEAMKTSLAQLQVRIDMFAPFVEKELGRGSYMEALAIYHRVVLGALVQVLRMKHKPAHYNFGTRYARYHLPVDVVGALKELHFVANEEDLAEKYRRAIEWFGEAVREVDFSEVEGKLIREADQ
jgi:hypothetical protein